MEKPRTLGYRTALGDYTATDAQLALLPFADFIKVDVRDLALHGTTIMSGVHGDGRILVAERVETSAELHMAIDHGFDLFQGHLFEAAEVLSIPVRSDPNPAR